MGYDFSLEGESMESYSRGNSVNDNRVTLRVWRAVDRSVAEMVLDNVGERAPRMLSSEIVPKAASSIIFSYKPLNKPSSAKPPSIVLTLIFGSKVGLCIHRRGVCRGFWTFLSLRSGWSFSNLSNFWVRTWDRETFVTVERLASVSFDLWVVLLTFVHIIARLR